MLNTLFIVKVEEAISEYAQKLEKLVKARDGIEVTSCTLNEYSDMASLANIVFEGAKFIFVGVNSSGQSVVPHIASWKYERFGQRIGWSGNKCVIIASDSVLSYSDYKEFRNYCKGLQLDYPDVVVPPEISVAGGLEWVNKSYDWMKNFFTDKKNRPVHQAQYSTLVYEFVNNYLAPFMSSEEIAKENTVIPADLKDTVRDLKAKASANLTYSQSLWCHAIIHGASIACAAIAFVPIPVADAIPITGAQVSMVLGLGKVFDNTLTKTDAETLLKTVAAPLAGRALSKVALALVPGVGWAINGAIAGTITEILGWTIANDFALKSRHKT
ncbi:MAG: DUF697 domain-containing protein [Synergistaceae bacterium]|jgi:uncharacterized protein (DUF697 family)|nr:DUF697 domain-containing protein [Synergistaceae bacterium]